MRLLFFITTALLIAVVSMARAEERTIAITGTGVVEAVPDIAVITLGVTHEEAEAQAAMQQTSAAVSRILDRLDQMGIEPRDVQTRDLSLQPVWSAAKSGFSSGREITGFAASNRVLVRVRDLKDLGQVLDAVIADGANDFNGLQFSMANPKPLADEARAKAVADAMDKAGQLATAAGVELGPVMSISDVAGGGRPMMRMAEMAMADAGSVPVAAGEVSITASVAMVFAIAD